MGGGVPLDFWVFPRIVWILPKLFGLFPNYQGSRQVIWALPELLGSQDPPLTSPNLPRPGIQASMSNLR